MLTTVVGMIAGACTATSMVPQAVKVWRTNNTHGVSLPAYIILFLGASLWVCYGVLVPAPPIVITNMITVVSSGVVVFLKLTNSHRSDDNNHMVDNQPVLDSVRRLNH